MASKKQGDKPAGAATRQRPAQPVPPGSANRGFGSVDPERQGYKPGTKPLQDEGSAEVGAAGAVRKPRRRDSAAPKEGAAQQGGGAAAADNSRGDKPRSSRRR